LLCLSRSPTLGGSCVWTVFYDEMKTLKPSSKKEEKKSDKPSLKQLLKQLPPIKWLWIGVAVLFFGNVLLLFFVGPSLEEDRGSGGKILEEDTLAFERLSFWERLLKGSSELFQSYSVIDGLPIDSDYEESIVSVMIDNFSLARPQHSGVRSASIVYEALVEGGITRLMLIFPYQETMRVGPVRSARDYFVDFSEEYGGIYFHAGGSPTSLDQLWASDRVYSMEEDERLKGLTYSFRDPELEAPHDLFVDLLLTRERAEDLEYDLQGPEQSWCFMSDTNTLTGDQVSRIELDFSNDPASSYYVQFQYDSGQNQYKRFYGAEKRSPHIDQLDLLQVSPTNLVVQIIPSFLINGDEKERLELDHIGTGKALYYMNGVKQVGSWTKISDTAPTRFLNSEGDPLCVNPGQTWVAVVDSEELVVEGR